VARKTSVISVRFRFTASLPNPPIYSAPFLPASHSPLHNGLMLSAVMTSHLHPTLSAIQCHQLHLHVSDGGFSLPDMLLVRDSAFLASFSQCIHDVTDILNLIQPLSIDDVLCASHHYHDPSQDQPPITSFLHTPALSVQSLLVFQRSDFKLQHSLYNRCYQHSLTTFRHSL